MRERLKQIVARLRGERYYPPGKRPFKRSTFPATFNELITIPEHKDTKKR